MSQSRVILGKLLLAPLLLLLLLPKALGVPSISARHAARLALYILNSVILKLHADTREMAEICLRRVQ